MNLNIPVNPVGPNEPTREAAPRLGDGDSVKARVLESADGRLTMRLEGGTVVTGAASQQGGRLGVGDLVELTYRRDAAGSPSYELRMGAGDAKVTLMEAQPGQAAMPGPGQPAMAGPGGISISSEGLMRFLESLGHGASDGAMKAIADMGSAGAGLSREALMSLIDMIAANGDLAADKAAFLLEHGVAVSQGSLDVLNGLIGGSMGALASELADGLRALEASGPGGKAAVLGMAALAGAHDAVSAMLRGADDAGPRAFIGSVMAAAGGSGASATDGLAPGVREALTDLLGRYLGGDQGAKAEGAAADALRPLHDALGAYLAAKGVHPGRAADGGAAYRAADQGPAAADAREALTRPGGEPAAEAGRAGAVRDLSAASLYSRLIDALADHGREALARTAQSGGQGLHETLMRGLLAKADGKGDFKASVRDMAVKAEMVRGALERADLPAKAQALSALGGLGAGFRLMGDIAHNTTYLQIPLMMGERKALCELFVLRKKGGKKRIDPENATMYVFLDTKNIGGVGTTVTVTKKLVSLSFRLDEERLLGYVKGNYREIYDRLRDIGYVLVDARYRVSDEGRKLSLLNFRKELGSGRAEASGRLDMRF